MVPPSPAFRLLGGAVDLQVELARVAERRLQLLGHLHLRLALVGDRAVDDRARGQRPERERPRIAGGDRAGAGAGDRALVVAEVGARARGLAHGRVGADLDVDVAGGAAVAGVRLLGGAVDLQVELARVAERRLQLLGHLHLRLALVGDRAVDDRARGQRPERERPRIAGGDRAGAGAGDRALVVAEVGARARGLAHGRVGADLDVDVAGGAAVAGVRLLGGAVDLQVELARVAERRLQLLGHLHLRLALVGDRAVDDRARGQRPERERPRIAGGDRAGAGAGDRALVVAEVGARARGLAHGRVGADLDVDVAGGAAVAGVRLLGGAVDLQVELARVAERRLQLLGHLHLRLALVGDRAVDDRARGQRPERERPRIAGGDRAGAGAGDRALVVAEVGARARGLAHGRVGADLDVDVAGGAAVAGVRLLGGAVDLQVELARVAERRLQLLGHLHLRLALVGDRAVDDRARGQRPERERPRIAGGDRAGAGAGDRALVVAEVGARARGLAHGRVGADLDVDVAGGAAVAGVRLLGGAVDLQVELARVAERRLQLLGHLHLRLALVGDRAVDDRARGQRPERERPRIAGGDRAGAGAGDRALVVAEVGARARGLAHGRVGADLDVDVAGGAAVAGVRLLGGAVDLQVELARVAERRLQLLGHLHLRLALVGEDADHVVVRRDDDRSRGGVHGVRSLAGVDRAVVVGVGETREGDVVVSGVGQVLGHEVGAGVDRLLTGGAVAGERLQRDLGAVLSRPDP